MAALTVVLWQKFPDFGQVLMAKLFVECPFLVPFVPQKLSGQSDDDFLNSWGYRVKDGIRETPSEYQLRTTRFAGFLAAIWITQPKHDEQSPHPLGIDNCWTFFVNVVNAKPNSIHVPLINKILDTAGSTMISTFGKQFAKIMIIFKESYMPSIEGNNDDDMKGAIGRLRNTINKYFTENRFLQPKGKLSPNFW